MQDRTHRGGAVLWYLRKHAPMPTNYAEVEASKSDPGGYADSKSTSKHELAVPRKPAPRLAPQHDFLHRTLCAIGAELDETTGGGAGSGSSSSPGKKASAMHREYLRSRFIQYNNAECEQLRAAVKAKEEEVRALMQKAEELQRFVENTRIAAKRRLATGRRPSDTQQQQQQQLLKTPPEPGTGSANFTCSSLAISAMVRTRQHFLDLSGTSVFDAESHNNRADSHASRKARDAVEELQECIKQQKEVEQALHGQVFELARMLKHQTIQRKAQEAGLFSKNAEILQLRARTLQTEARVTRLANELRRIYRQVPSIMQRRLDQTAPERAEHEASEFASLQKEHQHEHLKFLSCTELVTEAGNVNCRIDEMDRKTARAQEAMSQGKATSKIVAEKMQVVNLALGALREAWSKLAETAELNQTGSGATPRGSTSLQPPFLSPTATATAASPLSGSVLNDTVDVQTVLQDANVAASAIQELSAPDGNPTAESPSSPGSEEQARLSPEMPSDLPPLPDPQRFARSPRPRGAMMRATTLGM